MTDHRAQAQTPKKGEAPFEFDEILFSRTDERGVIQSGNMHFQRISGYSWPDLIGAPQKLMRHPDMPEGVFHLFWQRLKAGEMVSGYIKNLTADELHYWSYLIATPAEGGYLSVQVKPTSDDFEAVCNDYAAQRKREIDEGLSPEKSAQMLIQRLRDTGYADYPDFMAVSLAKELAGRDEKLGHPPSQRGKLFAQAAKAVREAISHTNALCETFHAIEAVPHNMRILASRLEASGGPIAAISSNYGSMSKEISDWVNQFVLGENSAFASLRSSLSLSRMLSATARVMVEAHLQFETEEREQDYSMDRDAERRRLESASQHFRDEANKYLGNVEREAIIFGRAVGEMKRMIAGLSTTRMMCKIESARLPEHNESLTAIIDQLDNFQSQLEDRLEKIGTITSTVLATARSLELGRRDDVNEPMKLRPSAA